MEIQNVESMPKAYKIMVTAEFATSTSPAGEVIPEIDSPERIAFRFLFIGGYAVWLIRGRRITKVSVIHM